MRDQRLTRGRLHDAEAEIHEVNEILCGPTRVLDGSMRLSVASKEERAAQQVISAGSLARRKRTEWPSGSNEREFALLDPSNASINLSPERPRPQSTPPASRQDALEVNERVPDGACVMPAFPRGGDRGGKFWV